MELFDRIRREYDYMRGALAALKAAEPIARDPRSIFPVAVERLAERHGDRPALVSSHETLTYRGYDSRANRYARWAREQGIGRGDVVALLMANRPEYMAVWLGIARTGGVTALLNTHLGGSALARTIDLVNPKAIIVDSTMAGTFAGAEPHLASHPAVWMHGDHDGDDRPDLAAAVAGLSDAPIPESERPEIVITDPCLYIYTSGTTGLPKAATINHFRVHGIMAAFSAAMHMRAEDRMYVCLPMYHTSGGVLAPGSALMAGGSVFIRDRFSPRAFWNDVSKHDCTAVQYIGELCRYLVNSPTHPLERSHKLRLATGNGLRPDIWETFRTRFAIPRIFEWYASTEGNCVLFNFDGKVGAVGRVPGWAKRRFPIEVVRFDPETEMPVRGADGRCVRCAPDEVGEVIARIVEDPYRPSQRFDGYSDRAATETKILRDVFEPGDRWFRSGDLMRRDRQGYFYFVDRIGDTFRWKGENVATGEVAEAFTAFPGIREANVYGVRIPGTEGRAGMAAIAAEEDIDLAALFAHLAARLPAYARPLFLRVTPEIAKTSTMKQRKLDLVREGYDPTAIADPLFVIDRHRATFRRLDREAYEAIVAGELKL